MPIEIETGANLEASHLQLFWGEQGGQLLGDPRCEIGSRAVVVLRDGWFEGQWAVASCFRFARGDESFLLHAADHDAPPLQGDLGVHQRGIQRGCGWHPSDQSRFWEGEFLRLLGEIHPGRIGDAIGAGSEIHKIEVLLEDLPLAQLTLELVGQCCFFEFARDRPVLAQEHRARQLLGDRARSFANRALLQICDDGPSDSPEINAVMVKEAAVFSCNEGLHHQLGHLPWFDLFPGRWSELLDHLAVARQERDRARPVEKIDSSCIRQGRINRSRDRGLPERSTTTNRNGDACDQEPMTTGANHIPCVRGLWPIARAVTSIPSTRKGWALA